MSPNRFSARAFMRFVAVSASLTVATVSTASASEWKPEKDVEMIISYAPGGGLDLFARKVIDVVRVEKLAPVNINPENKSGGSGAVGWGWVKANRNDANETLTRSTPLPF